LAQRSKVFWRVADLVEKQVRPDIVIEGPDRSTLVLDTKWKVLETPVPSDDDLKQMFVYNALWDCPESVLVYPQVWGLGTTTGTYPFSKTSLRVAFLDLDASSEDWERLIESQ
jgi:5-methylcytosine-specific restriction enzyme subunit McrC